jgi:hypothetical protein
MLDQAVAEDLPYRLVEPVAVGRWKVGRELISAISDQFRPAQHLLGPGE